MTCLRYLIYGITNFCLWGKLSLKEGIMLFMAIRNCYIQRLMIKIKVQLSDGIRCVVKKKPATFVVESPQSVTIRQLAHDLGIPLVLIAFAIENGQKKNLDDVVESDATIQFFGTMAGG